MQISEQCGNVVIKLISKDICASACFHRLYVMNSASCCCHGLDHLLPFFRATDADSDDDSITFTLAQPYSTAGQLILRKQNLEDQRGWTRVSNLWEKRVTSFTQYDIDQGTNCSSAHLHNGLCSPPP